MRVGLDTSFIVHVVRQGTPQHRASWACYLEHRRVANQFVVADNVVLEAFLVLSRAAPVRLAAKEAERVLQSNFGDAIVAPMRPGLAWETIRHTLDRGCSGGRVYDAAIALATYEAGARLLLTWNVRHFMKVAPLGLEIRQP